MKALTGTPEQITQKLDELNGLIEKDENGIEMFAVIPHFDSGLQTLVYQPKIKKIRKQPKRSELNKKAQIYGWEVERTNNNKYRILHGQNGAIMVETKTIVGIQRKLTNLIHEWYQATSKFENHIFLKKYNVIN